MTRALFAAIGCLLLQAVLARDAPFAPSPPAVVETMLALANVGPGDVVYDLGSGDGRIVIQAALKHGARGVGIEIDARRIREARENASAAGVADRVAFREGDLFEADLGEATVVTLYLLTSANMRLQSKLLRELAPGTRVVSHGFDMGTWQPQAAVEVEGRPVYLWIIPAR